jgi:hypothetical protein
MSEPDTKTAMLTKLTDRYVELDGLIGQLSDAQLTQVGVTDEWTMCELLAHLTWWQERVFARMRGDPPRYRPAEEESDEAFWRRVNAIAVQGVRERSASEVLAAFRASHQQMTELIAGLTDEQVANEDVIGSIAGNSFDHYEEHLPAIRTFAQAQKGS